MLGKSVWARSVSLVLIGLLLLLVLFGVNAVVSQPELRIISYWVAVFSEFFVVAVFLLSAKGIDFRLRLAMAIMAMPLLYLGGFVLVTVSESIASWLMQIGWNGVWIVFLSLMLLFVLGISTADYQQRPSE